MALVVEDGTLVATANTYVVVADVRSFTTDRGFDFSGLSDAAVAALILKASDYLEFLSTRYVGNPTSTTQGLSWPRANVQNSDGTGFPSSGAGSIPSNLKNAQCQLCIEQNNGVVLLPTIDNFATGGFIVSDKIGPLETRYSEKVGTSKLLFMPSVERWLNPLFAPRPGGLISVRV